MDILAANEDVCRSFGNAILDGKHLSVIPKLLKKILKEGMWKRRKIATDGRVVEHVRFEDFVTTPPLEGIGADMVTVKNLIREDLEAVDLLDRAVQNKPGRPTGTRNNVTHYPEGNSRDKAIRRLRKDAPELHERVLAGELSPHRAMVQAGFRKEPTRIERMISEWNNATEDERGKFLHYLAEQGHAK